MIEPILVAVLGGKSMFRWVMLLLTLVMTSFAHANVSTKNGNFYLPFKDVVTSGGLEMGLERTFNSKSSHNGWFGFGWSSEYETFVVAAVDGSIVVHENGGGAVNRFVPPSGVTATDVNQAVEAVMAARAQDGGNQGDLAKYRERLRSDARYRNDEWERFWRRNLVQSRNVAPGTQFRSIKYSFQILTRTATGYTRVYDNGRVETFNNRGQLTRIADKNQNYVNFNYDRQSRLTSVEDNFHRRFRFTFNERGRMTALQVEGGRKATYAYDGDMLIKSTDVDKNTYTYRYSTDGRYNLVEVGYADKTNMRLAYHPQAQGEGIKSVRDRDGTITEYDYSGDPVNGLNYSTKVTVKSSDGKVLSTNKYEYFDKTKADGERYTYRMVADVDGEKTETVYNECCGLPLKIITGNQETSFEYDQFGHVTKKSTPTEVAELQYHPKVGKITKVMRYSRSDASAKSQEWANYDYDERGNLVSAKSSSGDAVKLIYDSNGRIKAMVDQKKQRLEFTYNEQSQPITIADPALGRINVAYGPTGEIKNVTSTGGRQIASQVSNSFYKLVNLLRPAGITLTK